MARYRELLKITARHNSRVNGWFICDRGRFAEKLVNDGERPRRVLVDGRDASWNEALEQIVARTAALPPGSVALVASSRLSLEGAALLPQLAAALPAGSLSYFLEEREAAAAAATVSRLTAASSASLQAVADADCIVICECDLRDEAPMLLLAVRQAWRKGAPVLLVGKGAPLAQAVAVAIEAVDIDIIEEAPVGIFDRPVIIFSTISSSAAAIENLFRAEVRFAPIFAGPNGCGAALLAARHAAVSLETALASGRIRGIIAIEADVPAALANDIPVIAAIDWQRTGAVERAEVVLPSRAWVEMDGTFINNEGRAQRFRQVMPPGLPVAAALEAGHPPRGHRSDIPGGDVRQAARIVADLLGMVTGVPQEPVLPDEWAHVRTLDPEGEGTTVLP
jgi:NADH-quinone oxidoreductase subunit G